MQLSRLQLRQLPELDLRHRTYDFIVDGISLAAQFEAHKLGGLLGRFEVEDVQWNEASANAFLDSGEPDVAPDRRMLFVCNGCADFGCGAVTAGVKKRDGIYEWSDFWYWNGMEEFDLVRFDYPALFFNAAEYERFFQRIAANKTIDETDFVAAT